MSIHSEFLCHSTFSLSFYFCLLSTYLSFYLPIYLCFYLSVNLPIYLCLSIYLSINLPIYLSVCLCINLSIYLSVCLCINLSIYLSIFVRHQFDNRCSTYLYTHYIILVPMQYSTCTPYAIYICNYYVLYTSAIIMHCTKFLSSTTLCE